jgi:VanZ family protein
MVFIFFLSSQSTIGIGETRTQRFLILKTFHLIEYAVLYVLIYFATNSTKKSIPFAYFYALSDEYHQSLVPGREGRFTDTLIDLIGIFIGVIFIKILVNLLNTYKKSSPQL